MHVQYRPLHLHRHLHFPIISMGSRAWAEHDVTLRCWKQALVPVVVAHQLEFDHLATDDLHLCRESATAATATFKLMKCAPIVPIANKREPLCRQEHAQFGGGFVACQVQLPITCRHVWLQQNTVALVAVKVPRMLVLLHISAEVLLVLLNHGWPKNVTHGPCRVRELRIEVARAPMQCQLSVELPHQRETHLQGRPRAFHINDIRRCLAGSVVHPSDPG
mmetsp:Transcript_145834/g.406191  ORF Transcript_145834/g.406191 Transcript_145834/m.406191 type:complete len:220 (-) Transcript_145834:780-1439(-)